MKLRNWSLFIFLSLVSMAYGQDYYWYKNNKIFLVEGDMSYIVYSDNSQYSPNFIKTLKEDNSNGMIIKSGIISDKHFSKVRNVLYRTHSYHMFNDTLSIFITENFYVRLKSEEDTLLLRNFASRYGVKIVRKGSLSCWYILRCSLPSPYNALEMANIFYESGLFSTAEPEFLQSVTKTCVNDTYFNQQWNLCNTGQYATSFSGIDLNYCEVHSITTGENYITIAVVDDGIMMTHPDLMVSSVSYDAHTLTSPSHLYGYHGTACAGIIGAQSNNSLGIAGIAPGCSLMSISWIEGWTPVQHIAEGINFARKNNVSIISNSWACRPNEYIDNAIDSALYYGRNGKGCVVVCACGNNNLPVIRYPANANPDIITVGAITPSAERKDTWDSYIEPNVEQWGSNYGKELDVMAPGIYIPTTDTTGYCRLNFRGTSAACPHVAAVAGLILSVNPDLTQQEVGYIISATAQKVGNYNYTDSVDYPYGSWHREMGYGLVDAYAAVQMALNRYIQDTVYSNAIGIVKSPQKIYAGDHVTNFKQQGYVVLPSGSDMHYIAGNSIHLEPGFRVERGAHFYAEIGNVTYPNTMPERRIELDNEYNRITNREQGSRIKQTYIPNTPFATKFLRDGQLIIKSGDNLFNAEGLRIK